MCRALPSSIRWIGVGANFENVCEMMRKRLGANVVPIQIPLGNEDEFEGVIDLVEMKVVRWIDEAGLKMLIDDIPNAYLESAQKARQQMLEALAEADEEIMALILNGEEPSKSEIYECLRKLTIKRLAVPVLCGTALRNRGVQPVLDAVVRYLPAPVDLDSPEGNQSRSFLWFRF